MATEPTQRRVTALEQTMLDLAEAHARGEARLARTEANLDSISREMRASDARFEAKLDRLAEERHESDVQTTVNLDRLSEQLGRLTEQLGRLSEENKEFWARAETARVASETARVASEAARVASEAASKAASKAATAEANRQWGEMSNKLGTLVEDLVAPSVPRIFREVFGLNEEPDSSIRTRRRHSSDRSQMREFDVLAYSADLLLINETKSKLRPEDLSAFLGRLADAREYLSEAKGRKIVGALASFYVDPSLVTKVQREGLLILGLGSGLMEILNTPGFKPKQF